ncbi:MAG TPA: nicotinate phosphoribosyltransferase [Acidimicrobiales bacterium]|nr:nicotinate phosphoribosyltransferase [Acidimicrobiales bacterium]
MTTADPREADPRPAPGGHPAPPARSTALLTDHYELTMLDAALQAGTADIPATFEVFARWLPPGRKAGVFAGLGRLLDALECFRFGPSELAWLERHHVVSAPTLEWLAAYRFSGDIDAYAEGEWYTVGSPVLTVSGPFGESVLLETLVLSILNYDTAVASAASLMVAAAGDRPIIEMGSRRADPDAAVAAARAAYLAGFESTSNLEAGRRYAIPTGGTSAHAFVLAFADERRAFQAQVDALGPDTTLLVDTYDIEGGIANAVDVAGPGLGAVRIDSGDLAAEARKARAQLDRLGARTTRVVVTGDLDDRSIRDLAALPVDAYGVGTNVVTGLGAPTAGFVYKLVAVGGGASAHAVAKRSAGKATVGGRKRAWRVQLTRAPEAFEGPARPGHGPVVGDVVVADGKEGPEGGRPLQHRVVDAGEVVGKEPLGAARRRHAALRSERPDGEPLIVVRP